MWPSVAFSTYTRPSLKLASPSNCHPAFCCENWLGAWEWDWWCMVLMCGQCIGDRTCTVGSVLVQHVLQYLCWSCRREQLCQLPFPLDGAFFKPCFQAPPISFSVLWKPSGSGNRASLIILLLCRRENNLFVYRWLILDGRNVVIYLDICQPQGIYYRWKCSTHEHEPQNLIESFCKQLDWSVSIASGSYLGHLGTRLA